MLTGHGDDIYLLGSGTDGTHYDDLVNFSSNVYQHFYHEELYRYLSSCLTQIGHYPHPTAQPLQQQLASQLHIQPQHVVVTNGATEAIYLIARTFPHLPSVIPSPTFSEYADAVSRSTLHVHNPIARRGAVSIFPCSSNFELQTFHSMLWLCNPNNPTGHVIPADLLRTSILRHPNRLYIIDASYAAYTLCETMTPEEAVALPNVILLHSMTKQFGIPGLRLGYITSNAALIRQIETQLQPWSVSQLAVCAGGWLLDHADEYQFPLQQLIQERIRLTHRLNGHPLIARVHPSDCHILLLQSATYPAAQLKQYLLEQHHLLVRDASNFSGLTPYHLRIAVQDPDENDRFLQALDQLNQR